MRSAFMAMLFSSSVGMNSAPSRVNNTPAPASSRSEPRMNAIGARTAPARAGRYAALNPRMMRLSVSVTLPVITMAIMAGTKVSERTKAATNAMMTVSAIGSNILPSTPVKVRSGT